jgi:hypothetical protein
MNSKPASCQAKNIVLSPFPEPWVPMAVYSRYRLSAFRVGYQGLKSA